jgi:hypothetical protein
LPGGALADSAGPGRGRTTREGPALDLWSSASASSMLVQLFTGGVLGVFRGAQGRWTVRVPLRLRLHWGRLVRVSLLVLLSAGLVRLWAPLSSLADLGPEFVSESRPCCGRSPATPPAALGPCTWRLPTEGHFRSGRPDERGHGLRLRGGFLRHLPHCPVLGVVIAGSLRRGLGAVDAAEPTGYRTQLLFLLLAQCRGLAVALRLWLLASQVALTETRRARPDLCGHRGMR